MKQSLCQWFMLFISAIFIFRPGFTASLKIVRENTETYLVHQDARLLLEQHGYPVTGYARIEPVAVHGGYTIQQQAWESIVDPWNDVPRRLTIRKDGHVVGQVDLQATLDTWVQKRVDWGTSERNNSIAHWAMKENHGVVPIVSDLTPDGASALAVLSAVARGPSGRPIYGQMLTRLNITPPSLTARMPLSGFTGGSPQPMPRIFSTGRQLLLYTNPSEPFEVPSKQPARFVLLGPDGTPTRTMSTLPSKYTPQGMIDNRWIVMANSRTVNDRVYLYDLTRFAMKRLRGPWDMPRVSLTYTIPPQGGYMMIGIQHKTNPTYLVRLSDGFVRALPNHTGSSIRFIWRKMAIIISGDRRLRAYDVVTGKLLTSVTM